MWYLQEPIFMQYQLYQGGTMENNLVIFISSVMNKDVDDLAQERYIAERSITSLPLATPWLFESSPAYTECVEKSYLDKVKKCDIFVLILGISITEPVKKEYTMAKNTGKPTLVFIKKCEGKRSPELDIFIKEVLVKWREFTTTEFGDLVTESVIDEVIIKYRKLLDLKGGKELIPEKLEAFETTLKKLEVINEKKCSDIIKDNFLQSRFYPLKKNAPKSPMELIKENPEDDKILPIMAVMPKLQSIPAQIEFAMTKQYADLYSNSWADIEVQLIGYYILKELKGELKNKDVSYEINSMYDAGCANCGQYKALVALENNTKPDSSFKYFGQDFNPEWKSRFNIKNGEFSSLPLPLVEERKMDIVACTHVLHCLAKNPIAIYTSLFSFNKILNSNGYCYITVPLKDAQPGMHYLLARSACDSGFKIIHFKQYRLTHELRKDTQNVTSFIYMLLQKQTDINLNKYQTLLGISLFRSGDIDLAKSYGISREGDISEELRVFEEDLTKMFNERNQYLKVFRYALDLIYKKYYVYYVPKRKRKDITRDTCHQAIEASIKKIHKNMLDNSDEEKRKLPLLCAHYFFWLVAWYLTSQYPEDKHFSFIADVHNRIYRKVENSLKNPKDVRASINDLTDEHVARLIRHLFELCDYENIDIKKEFDEYLTKV
jgi:hypothetical protein